MKKFLLNFFTLKKREKKNTLISSLAPKVLKKEEAIGKIQPYLDKLKETIDTNGISNIALTGGYGSGKSTIIKTFQSLNPQYEYLNISLASFNKGKNDKKGQKEELERLLEVSILQQIFYHVKPTQIPESRFKRIINIPNWKIWLISFGFILWVSSSILLLKYDYLDKINPNNWNNENSFDWFSLLIFLIAFTGLGLFSNLIIKSFSNSKINKINIKGELELGDSVNKSVFNEHLEEILYFFERTKYDVVIIEDLDRFDSTNIFTKLREINILLNNSKLINREVNFVYAVGDDLFEDKKERVKFFEYIIPIIPFINSSNADEQLRTLIIESGLEEDILTKEFISDIITFIDDIDMRLLTNIFHEFIIYRKTLKPEFIKKNDELFAIIIYKNIDPKDFTKLNRREGKLFDLINNKKTYIEESIKKMENKIQLKDSQIENIRSHSITDVIELRAIYVNKVLSKLPNNAILSNQEIAELLEDKGFENIISNTISYKQFTSRQYSNDIYNEELNIQLKYNFKDIENEVNTDYTYAKRVELIESKQNNHIDVLKNEIGKLEIDKSKIENWDLKQIFNKIDVNKYLNDFSNDKLLRNLILNGYINENYNDYISLFHEVSITKEDFNFERNVKSGYATKFSFKLYSIENLVERINQKYFEREAILNFDLLNYLGNNYSRYSTKYDLIISLLSNKNEKSIQFIDEYIENEDRPIRIFIEKLTKKWDNFFGYICYYRRSDSRNTENKYLELIIRFSKIETIINIQNTYPLKTKIESLPSFLSLIKNTEELNFFQKITNLLKELNIKFDKLEKPNEETKELFDYVYRNHHYKINEENLLQMLSVFGKENIGETFKNSNYSTIEQSNCEPLIVYINSNITAYVQNVYLKLEENKFENENDFIKLLNKNDLEIELKIKIIQKIETKIDELEKINELEIKTQLLINNKVTPQWSNVIDYYNACEETINENLIKYLEFEDIYTELSKEKMIFKSDSFDYASFRENLFLCNEISSESYEHIFRNSIYKRDILSFENLNDDKIIYLVNNILNTTKSNYDLLRKHFQNNHITLIEKNFTEFIKNIIYFETDKDDVLLLLESDQISADNKFSYISLLDEKEIVDNKEISEIVGDIILQKSIIVEFEYDTIKSLVEKSNLIKNKVKIINLYSSKFDDNELICITKLVSSNYGKMFKKQHKPAFKNTDYNKTLFSLLKSKGLIKNFNVDKKDKLQIRVIANY